MVTERGAKQVSVAESPGGNLAVGADEAISGQASMVLRRLLCL